MAPDSTGDDGYQRMLSRYNELAALAGSLAHEIKNPLSVIRMNMELLREDLGEAAAPELRRAVRKVDIVQQQCVRLENLLNDFLRFARLRHLELEPGSLNEQITQVLDLFEPQARELGVEIKRYLANDLPTIRLHAETLQAALVNLVKNSLEAMSESGGQLIAITHVTTNGAALDLIDTGCGIDDRTLLRMFDAFYSTKDGGSGLGLPTARKIVEAHGGRITVQSQIGRGTKFVLEFPLPARLN